MSSNNNKSNDLRTQIIEEMEARRIDHKTYVDAKWLLDQYDTLKDQAHKAEVEEAVREERERAALIVEELMEDSEFWQPIATKILGRNIYSKADITTPLPESDKQISMEIPINEIKRLIKNPNNDVGFANAVYVTPAQKLRNRADDIEREEKDYRIVREWLNSLESDKTE